MQAVSKPESIAVFSWSIQSFIERGGRDGFGNVLSVFMSVNVLNWYHFVIYMEIETLIFAGFSLRLRFS